MKTPAVINKSVPLHLVVLIAAVMCLFVVPAISSEFELSFEHRDHVVRAVPDPPADLPYHLIVDDDQPDGAFGVTLSGFAHQFMWFNRFTPPVSPLLLNEIWVLFPSGANMVEGSEVEVFVYLDPDGDPANGADLITSFTDVIQSVEGNAFSIYPINPPLFVDEGDVFVGVVNRFVESGVTSPTLPAAIDTTSSVGRSWIAVWVGDPASEPVLPANGVYGLIDDYQPGNWMIRAFGSDVPETIPVLQPAGALILVMMLIWAGGFLIRRAVH